MRNIALAFCAIVMVLGTFTSSFAQWGERGPEGWNCANPAEPGYCTKALERGDTAWNLSEYVMYDPLLWRRFVEDNPGKATVRTEGKKTFVDWNEGVTVRIRRDDYISLGGKPAAPATIQPAATVLAGTTQGPSILDPYVLLPAGILLLILVMLAALVISALQRRHGQERPAWAGPPMRNRDMDWFLNREPGRSAVASAFTNGTLARGFDRIFRVEVRGGRIPTAYGDGQVRIARPDGDAMYVGVRYGEQGQVTEATPAWALCFNPPARLTSEQARLVLRSNPEFRNPTVHTTARGCTAPADWFRVEQFLRNQLEQTANPVVAEAPVEQAATAAPAPSSSSVTLDGRILIRGRIDLPDGGKIEPGNSGAFVRFHSGGMAIDTGGVTLTISENPFAAALPNDEPLMVPEDDTNSAAS